MMILALALVTGIEQAPTKITADTPIMVATKTCHDLFDAAIAQRMADKNPGEIRNMVVEGERYGVVETRIPGAVWAIPLNPALGTIKAAASCFN